MPGLFDATADAWVHDPELAFDSWLARHGFSKATAVVYRAQWHPWLRWLALKRRRFPHDVDPALIEDYLGTLRVRREQRERLQRLIERVLDGIEPATEIGNPARDSMRYRRTPWRETECNEPTGFLDESEQSKLTDYAARRCASLQASTSLEAPRIWREGRDVALLALLWGAGLKVSEALELTVNCMDLAHGPWIWVRSAHRPMRRARLEPWAQPWLESWLRVREAHAVDDVLLPGRRAQPGRMNAATLSRRVHHVTEQAGIPAPRCREITAQTLRNDCAARMLREDVSHAEVAERLGYVEEASVARLHGAYVQWEAQRAGDGPKLTGEEGEGDSAGAR